jgi:hypothetical protein
MDEPGEKIWLKDHEEANIPNQPRGVLVKEALEYIIANMNIKHICLDVGNAGSIKSWFIRYDVFGSTDRRGE